MELSFLFKRGPWPEQGRNGAADPGEVRPWGEGEVRGKKEKVPAHLLVVLDRWEKVRKVLDGGGQGAAAEVQRRRGSPVRDWRQGEAGELRGPTVELARGSARAEEGCSGGSAVASSSPELRMDGGSVLRRRSGEKVKEREDQVAGVLVVLMRTRERGLGL